jgi:two-component system sensor histidine kinase KdpD
MPLNPRHILATLAEPAAQPKGESPWIGYGLALGGWSVVTIGVTGLAPWLGLVGAVLAYLLMAALIAARFGPRPALLAAGLSAGMLGYLLMPTSSAVLPRGQVAAAAAGLLGTAAVVAFLITDLRLRALQAARREQRAQTLYAMSRDLSSALMAAQIAEIAVAQVQRLFRARAALLLPDAAERVDLLVDAPPPEFVLRREVAQWVYDHQQPGGLGTDTLPTSTVRYLPLKAPMRTRGVLALEPADADLFDDPERCKLLDVVVAQIALALERVHYVQVAQEGEIRMASERLRNSILSAISHDLRTPLTALVGLSSALAEPATLPDDTRRELAGAVHEEALRMSALVINLLDMARLEVGRIGLNKQWQVVEEAVGGALRASRLGLAQHRVEARLDGELPLVAFDAVLVERVLCNLLENAGKYTPPGSHIVLGASLADGRLCLTVSDNGPGLAPGSEEAIFEKFTRGQTESATPGVGLGLAICRAIVEAHGGRIWAENRQPNGACFCVVLPADAPPAMQDGEGDESD